MFVLCLRSLSCGGHLERKTFILQSSTYLVSNQSLYPLLAPYKLISKHIEKEVEGDKVLLTCQSEGYPQSAVEWQDGRLQRHSPNTTTTTTPEHLVKITSQIQVSSSEENNYTCSFTNDALSATFHIPGNALCLPS